MPKQVEDKYTTIDAGGQYTQRKKLLFFASRLWDKQPK